MNRHLKSNIMIALIIAVLTLTISMFAYTAPINAEGENNGGKEIVIETIEDIPAGDIEEQPVPLAAMPDTQKRTEMRHAVMMIILLMGTAAYAIYFIRYENKLVMLRKKAAEAEEMAMLRRRDDRSGQEVQS